MTGCFCDSLISVDGKCGDSGVRQFKDRMTFSSSIRVTALELGLDYTYHSLICIPLYSKISSIYSPIGGMV